MSFSQKVPFWPPEFITNRGFEFRGIIFVELIVTLIPNGIISIDQILTLSQKLPLSEPESTTKNQKGILN